MIEKGICVLCNCNADEVHWVCLYCREFLPDNLVREVDITTDSYLQGELTTKAYAFYLATMRDIRDVNYLCDLHLPEPGEGKRK